MKKRLAFILLGLTFIVLTAFTVSGLINWKVKEEAYAVTFKGPKVEGYFKGLKADINFDKSNPGSSKIIATVDVATVDVGNWLKTKHTKAALGADDYPVIRFESSAIEKKGTAYVAKGSLMLKGVTKQVELPFNFSASPDGGVFEGKLTIAPKDFNVTRSGTPDHVEITLKVPVIQN